MNNKFLNFACLLTLIIIVNISTSLANETQQSKTGSFVRIGSGPYIGFGAGAIIAQYSNGTMSDRIQSFSFHMNKYAPAINLIAGYAFRLHEWHFGIEADYMIGNINSSFNHQIGNHNKIARIKSSDSFGAALRLGYHCDRILAYVRLGVENRLFHVTANSFGLDAQIIARNTINYKTRKTAFSPGIGLQLSMNRNLSATLEYRIALYNKVSTSLFTQIDQNTTRFSIRPFVNSVMISLRYHF